MQYRNKYKYRTRTATYCDAGRLELTMMITDTTI
jgi:hypothetical protein